MSAPEPFESRRLGPRAGRQGQAAGQADGQQFQPSPQQRLFEAGIADRPAAAVADGALEHEIELRLEAPDHVVDARTAYAARDDPALLGQRHQQGVFAHREVGAAPVGESGSEHRADRLQQRQVLAPKHEVRSEDLHVGDDGPVGDLGVSEELGAVAAAVVEPGADRLHRLRRDRSAEQAGVAMAVGGRLVGDQPVRARLHIVVGDDDEVAGGRCGALDERRHLAGRLAIQDRQRQASGRLAQDLGGRVGAGVVDGDDPPRPARWPKPLQGGHHRRQRPGPVVGGEQHGDPAFGPGAHIGLRSVWRMRSSSPCSSPADRERSRSRLAARRHARPAESAWQLSQKKGRRGWFRGGPQIERSAA